MAVKANAVVYIIRTDKHGLVPMLLTSEDPERAVQILDESRFSGLGVDSVVFVNANRKGDSYEIVRLAQAVLLENGDTTTSRKFIARMVRDGSFQEFLNQRG